MIVVETSEIVAHSLFITHSPRLYRDKLWLHNSGTGEFGAVEIDSGRFEPVAFAPGGLLKPRDNKKFSGLPLAERLEEKNARAKCGLQIMNLNIGDIVMWVKFDGVVHECYDVVALPGARRWRLDLRQTSFAIYLSSAIRKKVKLIQCFIRYSRELYVKRSFRYRMTIW